MLYDLGCGDLLMKEDFYGSQLFGWFVSFSIRRHKAELYLNCHLCPLSWQKHNFTISFSLTLPSIKCVATTVPKTELFHVKHQLGIYIT